MFAESIFSCIFVHDFKFYKLIVRDMKKLFVLLAVASMMFAAASCTCCGTTEAPAEEPVVEEVTEVAEDCAGCDSTATVDSTVEVE